LRDTGCQIDVADNGGAAFEKFVSGGYDLVFMDIQMPVVDGHVATRMIRDWEREKGTKPVPIVALTAHALKEEIERSLAAGCTAHLTKPIRKPELIEAIETYAGRSRPPSSSTIQVRVDSRLRELMPWFLDKRRKEVGVILSALEQSDFEIIRTLGHNMKGSGGGYGLPKVTDLGAAIESAAQQAKIDQVRQLATELGDYLSRLDITYD